MNESEFKMVERMMDELEIPSISELVVGSLETLDLMRRLSREGYSTASMIDQSNKRMMALVGQTENHILNKVQMVGAAPERRDDIIPFESNGKGARW